MKLKTVVDLWRSGQSLLALRLFRTTNEFYRAAFISTALNEGVYEVMQGGPRSLEELCEELGPGLDREGLRSWLELGVSLKELKKTGNGYGIKGGLSRKLALPENDAYRAVLEEIVFHHYGFVTNTPSMLRKKELFKFDDSVGELIARSSRISEPFILEAVEEAIPRSGDFRLLEIGCGSGIYIKHACETNPSLTATGLELQPRVAEFARNNIKDWGLQSRVDIEAADVREYKAGPEFDLVTLHQNIYYFAVDKRVELCRRLGEFLKPGGKLLLTSACQGGSPGMAALNIWVSVTEGYGPLPVPEQLCAQLQEAGLTQVRKKRLVPFESFWAFEGIKK